MFLADLSGSNGLSRGAIYDLERIRARHSSIISVDLSSSISGRKVDIYLRDPVENVYLFCQPDTYEYALRLVSPEALRSAYRIGRWVWETPVFPESWSFAQNVVHEVWTPSEFCAASFRDHLSVPISVVPHAVTPPPISDINMRHRLGISSSAFLGLAIMDLWSCPDRKNPWAHVRVWQKAFGQSQDAVLVLKVRVGKRTSVVLKELHELSYRNENIRILTEFLSEAEISALRQCCDVFISLHRSEGYGLNIHEALLSGKPTLATDWSACNEYGPRFYNYHGIKYNMIRYRDWTGHYENSDFSWADADLSHAASELRKIYFANIAKQL